MSAMFPSETYGPSETTRTCQKEHQRHCVYLGDVNACVDLAKLIDARKRHRPCVTRKSNIGASSSVLRKTLSQCTSRRRWARPAGRLCLCCSTLISSLSLSSFV
eukprot:4946622-Pleurochrysis_carterae.AAC.2